MAASASTAEMMARLTAERLVQHLQRSGYVVMKGPPVCRRCMVRLAS
jgi:hypothetical protein